MAEVKFQSLEDITSAYIQATEAETDALFEQGDVILAAVDSGFKVKDVVSHCASLTRRTKRTVFTRYAVARTFKPDVRHRELDWSMHALCAATDKPLQWLEIASEGYTDANGTHKGHTYRTLKFAIKNAGGDPDKGRAEILLDSEPCTLQRIVPLYLTGTHEAVFNLTMEQAEHLRELPYGVQLQITLVKAPSPIMEQTS
jgi:hypothetical protein